MTRRVVARKGSASHATEWARQVHSLRYLLARIAGPGYPRSRAWVRGMVRHYGSSLEELLAKPPENMGLFAESVRDELAGWYRKTGVPSD